MVPDDDIPFVLILVSLFLFTLLAEHVKINGLLLFLVVAIAVDRPRCMSQDAFKAGLVKSFGFFLPERFFFNF